MNSELNTQFHSLLNQLDDIKDNINEQQYITLVNSLKLLKDTVQEKIDNKSILYSHNYNDEDVEEDEDDYKDDDDLIINRYSYTCSCHTSEFIDENDITRNIHNYTCKSLSSINNCTYYNEILDTFPLLKKVLNLYNPDIYHFEEEHYILQTEPLFHGYQGIYHEKIFCKNIKYLLDLSSALTSDSIICKGLLILTIYDHIFKNYSYTTNKLLLAMKDRLDYLVSSELSLNALIEACKTLDTTVDDTIYTWKSYIQNSINNNEINNIIISYVIHSDTNIH